MSYLITMSHTITKKKKQSRQTIKSTHPILLKYYKQIYVLWRLNMFQFPNVACRSHYHLEVNKEIFSRASILNDFEIIF